MSRAFSTCIHTFKSMPNKSENHEESRLKVCTPCGKKLHLK